MRTFSRRRAVAATLAPAFVLSITGAAHATGITEFPDNGSEQGGRGGAWIARASDPLAAFYNPAGLAGQPTRVLLQSNFNFQKTCFTRIKAANDPTNDPDMTAQGAAYPKVCSNDGAAVDPQLAMTFKVNDRVGIGFIPLLAPSGGASSISFPEFVSTTTNGRTTYQPAPQRYLLTAANLLVLNPTLGVGWEVVDRLRVGASFEWGIASLSFTNAVAALANSGSGAADSYSPASGDVKSVAKVHDYFFPGFTLGAMYSVTNDIDLAAWYKWSAPINAEGDVQTSAYYYSSAVAQGKYGGVVNGNTALANCGVTGATGAAATLCGSGNNLSFKVPEPMEAKIGVRYHKRRSDVPYDPHVRDPMAQDVFDIETDLTWANDSTFQSLQVRLPGDNGIGTVPINGLSHTTAPPNDDIPHGYKDVFGVRLGGDFNVLPDQLAVRGGGFFQSNGQNAQDQGIDFPGSMNFGLAAGATYRLHLSKEKSSALEFSLGYEHVFYLNETYDGTGGVPAIAGTLCPNNGTALPGNTSCGANQPAYRTGYAVNLGTITNQINVLNAGINYRF